MNKIYLPEDVRRRAYWIEEIQKLSGVFGDDSQRLELELASEVSKHGFSSLISHLRLCGDIPEQYGHDSSEEKLYSKYTDCLIAETFKALGLKSLVLRERGDAADVEVFAKDYSFVADARAIPAKVGTSFASGIALNGLRAAFKQFAECQITI